MTQGGATRYTSSMPDDTRGLRPDAPPHQDPDPLEIERRLLHRAVEEADAEGGEIPHEVVRARMLADVARLREEIAALTKE